MSIRAAERVEAFRSLDLESVPSPAFVTDLALLEDNLSILKGLRESSGAKVLLALKGYAQWSTFALCAKYLDGTCASSVDEARLGREEFGAEVHAYAPAYSERDLESLLGLIDHLSLNSLDAWERWRPLIEATADAPSCGLRINPGYSEVDVAIYDPCAPCSRLGVPLTSVDRARLAGLDGLHIHALCGQNADVLERVVASFESEMADVLSRVGWLNLGGGHHVTRDDYDVDRLSELLARLRDSYELDVYIEPGEAVGLHCGVLVSSVLDIVHNEVDIAILDVSATAHMPDVLEMPYRPEIIDAGLAGERQHTYRLGGLSCLAGDVIGDYSFDRPLEIGQRLVFLDMAHYSMVKTSNFNGVRLPSIVLADSRTGDLRVQREFGHADFKSRLS